jgi:hypothetical protein
MWRQHSAAEPRTRSFGSSGYGELERAGIFGIRSNHERDGSNRE